MESQQSADAIAPSAPPFPVEAVQSSPFPAHLGTQIADAVAGWTVVAMHTTLEAFVAAHAGQPVDSGGFFTACERPGRTPCEWLGSGSRASHLRAQ